MSLARVMLEDAAIGVAVEGTGETRLLLVLDAVDGPEEER